MKIVRLKKTSIKGHALLGVSSPEKKNPEQMTILQKK